MENHSEVRSLPIEIINRKELLSRLGISEQHAIKLGKEGKLKSFRVGNSVRYNWNQVIEELQKNNNGTRKY
jgi:hypothetical protein